MPPLPIYGITQTVCITQYHILAEQNDTSEIKRKQHEYADVEFLIQLNAVHEVFEK